MGSHLVGGILAADPANELTVTTRKEFPRKNGCIRYVREMPMISALSDRLSLWGRSGTASWILWFIRPTNSRERVICCRYANNMFFEFGLALCRIERADRRNLAEVVGYRKR